jgi:hypothetical protein
MGYRSLYCNTSGSGNIGIGYSSLFCNTVGDQNIALGHLSLCTNICGTHNIAIGENTSSGNFSNSVILGRSATACANNQFVIGSCSYNVGSVTVDTCTSAKYWDVMINGSPEKILLA